MDFIELKIGGKVLVKAKSLPDFNYKRKDISIGSQGKLYRGMSSKNFGGVEFVSAKVAAALNKVLKEVISVPGKYGRARVYLNSELKRAEKDYRDARKK